MNDSYSLCGMELKQALFPSLTHCTRMSPFCLLKPSAQRIRWLIVHFVTFTLLSFTRFFLCVSVSFSDAYTLRHSLSRTHAWTFIKNRQNFSRVSVEEFVVGSRVLTSAGKKMQQNYSIIHDLFYFAPICHNTLIHQINVCLWKSCAVMKDYSVTSFNLKNVCFLKQGFVS